MFSYLTWNGTKLVLLSRAIVTLKSWWQFLFRKVQKKSPKYAVDVFEGEGSHE